MMRRVWWCASIAVFAPALIAQARVPAALLTPPDSSTDASGYRAAIRAACPHATPHDREALLRDEGRRSSAARGADATAEEWHALACVRALLDADDAPAREGLAMPLGAGWQEGATRAWLAALAIDSAHAASAEGLGVVALDQPFPREGDRVRAALTRAVNGGVSAPAAVRGCAILTVRAAQLERSNRCALVGLGGGGDSTWQLVHLSRLASLGADTQLVTTLFEAALKSAHDAAAWAEVGWHLRWFVEPAEWEEWRALDSSTRAAWIRDRLASRDVRDGRRSGARLVEHFRRLDHVEVRYRRDIPDHLRGFSRFAATHDRIAPPEDPDRIRFTSAPELVHAEPFRAFVPAVEWLDDRGVVYLRFGAPDKKAVWVDTNPKSALVRESWLYELDAGRILVHFESEAHDGSTEATRLVPGVLGHYLCVLDAVRCQLTNRLACWDLPGGCLSPPVSRERLEVLRTEDRSDIAIATTRDDNAPRTDHPIATVAQFSRVWDPRSGAPLAVIPYAVRARDVEREEDSTGVTATLALTLRQWDPVAASWQATEVTRRLRLPGRLRNDSHLTGYLVTRTTPATSAWSLFATQGAERAGRAWDDRLPPLADGDLTISDLVLGAASQGQTWTSTGGTAVPLGPLGAFDPEEPLSLYWQVRSGAPRERVRITIAIHRVGPRDTERPVLEVGFDARLAAGLTELRRDLGVANLDGGTYRVAVTVRDGEREASRSARLLLR